jgi:hypothetical protein
MWALQIAMALALAACTGNGATETTLPSSTSAPTTASTSVATPTTVAGTTTAPIDVHAIFEQALASTSANYRFQSEVSVGDTPVTTIQGVVDGESVAADVTAGTSQISYIRTPNGEWVTGPDEEWSVLEGEAPVGPPLNGLSDVTGLEQESTEGNSRVLLATLGPAAGPAAGARVTMVLVGGLISEIRYQAPSGSDTATVITTVTDVGTAGTVAAPEV